jgi:ribosomal protein S18 acetylase RimI-like enzyme
MSPASSEEYHDRLPTVAEFGDLFDSVGWPRYEDASTAAALGGSLGGTVALMNGDVIAMGRVVGDGGKFFYIQDVIVRPEYQGRGVGRRIVCRLMSAIEAMAPDSAFVGVFATPEAIPLYRKLGLDRSFGGLTGMAAVKEPGDIDEICAAPD